MVLLGETTEDENSPISLITMSLSLDPLFTLQMLVALFVVMTLRDEPAETKAITPAAHHTRAPFQLSDGHTYVEHAGMSIEQELYSTLCSEWPHTS